MNMLNTYLVLPIMDLLYAPSLISRLIAMLMLILLFSLTLKMPMIHTAYAHELVFFLFLEEILFSEKVDYNLTMEAEYIAL
jgi:hypothetical protein